MRMAPLIATPIEVALSQYLVGLGIKSGLEIYFSIHSQKQKQFIQRVSKLRSGN